MDKESKNLSERVDKNEAALGYLENTREIRNCPKCGHETLQLRGLLVERQGDKAYWIRKPWAKVNGVYRMMPFCHNGDSSAVETNKCLNCGSLLQEKQETVIIEIKDD